LDDGRTTIDTDLWCRQAHAFAEGVCGAERVQERGEQLADAAREVSVVGEMERLAGLA
jgi:hypothetical protein